jgi:hypothetical protein
MHSSGSYYIVKSKHSGKALDVCQDTDKKGMLVLWESWGGDNQKFNLKEVGM